MINTLPGASYIYDYVPQMRRSVTAIQLSVRVRLDHNYDAPTMIPRTVGEADIAWGIIGDEMLVKAVERGGIRRSLE